MLSHSWTFGYFFQLKHSIRDNMGITFWASDIEFMNFLKSPEVKRDPLTETTSLGSPKYRKTFTKNHNGRFRCLEDLGFGTVIENYI